jgi:hypothetical protein
VTLKWQLVALTALSCLFVGILLGRYAFRAGPHGVKITLPGGEGALYVPNEATKRQIERDSDVSDAQANVRAAIPGLEAYNADHPGYGYSGVSLTKLQQSYDAGIKDVGIVRADVSTYCVQSTVGTSTYHKEGPAGDIVPGPCA